ncbi:MAG: class I SAM-dependent methyltransferase [Cecembia sp.]
MRQQQCPVCGTVDSKIGKNFSLKSCEECGVYWTLIQSDINTAALYEDEVYAVVDNRNSIFEKIIFQEAKNVIQSVESLFKGKTAIRCLDFGSGKGQFLYQAQSAGWEAIGIETAPQRATFAQEKYGVSVIEEKYQFGKIDTGNYDVITLFHVLEHLPSPLELLKNLCENNLRKGGILVIEVPNIDSWQHKLAADQWMHLDIPKHLSHWNEKLLVNKVEALGFKKVKGQYFSLHLGVLGSLRALIGKFGYTGNIIYDLKNRKKPLLLLGIMAVLPISLLLEVFALPFRKTGIVRLYFIKDES